jgi:hypothetical protein
MSETAAEAEERAARRLEERLGLADWRAPAARGDLADAIEAYVKGYDWVTFPELMRKLEPHVAGGVRGPWALCSPQDPNVILWTGMSQAFQDAVRALLAAHRLFLHPAHLLTYLTDGGLLRMPLAKRVPKGGYQEPHWVPTCLRTVPMRERRRRAGRAPA